MTAFRRLITIGCLSLAPFALGQQPPATHQMQTQTATESEATRKTEPVTADTDKDLTDPRAMRLSLDDAIHTSIRQNLGIDVQRYDYLMSGQNLIGSWGVFDPVANATLSHSNAKNAPTNAQETSSSSGTTADFGISGLVPTGGSYSLQSTNARGTSAGGLTTLSPTYNTGLGLNLTQPLARNFGMDINRRNIYIARNTLGINQELFRGTLLDTTNAVEQAYDDLIYARQYVDVLKEALFLARDQARITQIRIDVGASAPLDILQPRVQIATAEQQLIAAVANVRSAEDRLRQLMNLPPADWDRPILPTDTVNYAPVDIDLNASVAEAYRLRPEVKENQLNTATRRINYQYARNQVLPRVDANAGYNLSGGAGRLTDNGVVTQNTNFLDATRQVLRNDFPGWNVGLTIGVPIFNTSARAEAKRAQLDLQQSQVIEAQTRQNIEVDVRSTARAIDTAAKEIVASKTARDAAEKNLDAERKRYENGMATNFEVLQIQQQLSDARASELQALVGYAKAVAAFHHSVGDLLDLRGITVDIPAVDEPHFFSTWDRYNWLNFASHDKGEEPLK
ncbi:MAG TPA: TolC family protein [Thermoanaerobaculia bacterium]|nr:TolC family protein [Thermoanaerobaculia bacterium]